MGSYELSAGGVLSGGYTYTCRRKPFVRRTGMHRYSYLAKQIHPMNLYKILGALILALSFIFTSCDWVGNEPTIEGDRYKTFDSSAQRKSFRVVNASGKRYNHKVDWDIVGIKQLWVKTYLTKKVDTLSNGDLKISYDWVSFTVKENKSVIEVEVQKNETGQDRSVLFATSNNHTQTHRPDIVLTQRAK